MNKDNNFYLERQIRMPSIIGSPIIDITSEIEESFIARFNLKWGETIFPTQIEVPSEENYFSPISFFPFPGLNGVQDENESDADSLIKLYTKISRRGKKRLRDSNKNFHGNKDFDNLQRKIQVHFLSFTINFTNDALESVDKICNYNFKQINQKYKITVNYKHILQLKNSTLKDLLSLEISEKYKKYKTSYNKELLEIIEDEWLNELFNINYLDLFRLYYNDKKPLGKIVLRDREIILSKKTKSFFYLLEKYKYLKQDIINIAERVYFNGIDNFPTLFSTRTMA